MRGRTNNVKPGTNTSDATAGAGDIRSGKTAYGPAGKLTGTLVQLDTSDATAVASDIRSGKSGYVNGVKVSGNLADNGALGTITPGTTDQTIPAGITSGGLVIGDADLLPENIKPGINLFGVNGTFTNDSNAVAADIKSGVTAYVAGVKLTGTMAAKGAQTYTPTTTDQTIAANQWLSGVQTISGDADLVAGNIKSGVNIFGVVGTFAGTGTKDVFQAMGLGNAFTGIASVDYSGAGVACLRRNGISSVNLTIFFKNSLISNSSGYITSIDGISSNLGGDTYYLSGYSKTTETDAYQLRAFGNAGSYVANLNVSGPGWVCIACNTISNGVINMPFKTNLTTSSDGTITAIDGVNVSGLSRQCVAYSN